MKMAIVETNDCRESGARAARQNQPFKNQYTLRSSGDVKQITKIQVGLARFKVGASQVQSWSRQTRDRAPAAGPVQYTSAPFRISASGPGTPQTLYHCGSPRGCRGQSRRR